MRILPFGGGSAYEAMRLDAELENHRRSAVAVAPHSTNRGGTYLSTPLPLLPQKTRLDWLSFTTSLEWAALKMALGCLFPDVEFTAEKRGMAGYPETTSLSLNDVPIGVIGHGAKHGKNLVSITGKGCAHWSNDFYSHVRDVVEFLEGKITRIDIAMDFFCGEVDYEGTLFAYHAGEFTLPKSPKAPMLGLISTSSGKVNLGRTMNVGSRKTSKMARCYEKGLEVFSRMKDSFRETCTDPASLVFHDDPTAPPGTIADQWFRVEIEFKAADCVLTTEMITARDCYFAGAYPFCARVLGCGDGVRPKSLKADELIALEQMLQHARACYGNLVHTLSEIGYSDTDIKNALTSGKHNQRLLKAGVLRALRSHEPDFDIPF